MAANDDFARQKAEAIAQIANVSKLLRDAIAASLPVAPEQYLTIAVPGTTIDTRNIKDGGTFVWDATDSAFTPTQVMQAEGKLVDSMIPLSNVMIGNTGKSVARSYARALDCLVAREATISTGAGGAAMRSPGNPTYDDAMKYLTTPDPESGLTKVDLYIQKQAAWANSQEAWDKAKINAKRDSVAKFPKDTVAQIQDYNDWGQANYRKFKFAVQGRYIDWVTNGYKYSVEQNFGIVDVDSIMARIEQSKESIRNSTIIDVDGANEVNLVSLTPKNWATLCKLKEDGWYSRNDNYTVEQVEAEISRLNRLVVSYTTMAEAMGFTISADGSLGDVDLTKVTYPIDPPGTEPSLSNAEAGLKTAYKDLYSKSAKLAAENKDMAGKSMTEKEAKPEWKKANDELNAARVAFQKANDDQLKVVSDYTKYAVASMKDTKSQTAIKSWLNTTLARTRDNIAKLEKLREQKMEKQPPRATVIADATADAASGKGTEGTEVAVAGDENPHPRFGITQPSTDSNSAVAIANSTPAAATTTLPQAGSTSDPWVAIKPSFSAQDQSSTETSNSWGMSVGGGAGWGLWSVGGSYSHDQSSTDFSSDMAACDVSVSFSCLVVNVGRPWLYGELFADSELDTAEKVLLSPGPQQLKAWMAAQSADKGTFDQAAIASLSRYSMFPAYPTSFVVATDTTIEFHGDTQHVEKHFSAQSNAGSVSVGWGPFSVSSSFHQSSSRESFQMQSTATGCRLTFGAPQVIGWVSQILPALPRLEGYEPMVQNGGTWKG